MVGRGIGLFRRHEQIHVAADDVNVGCLCLPGAAGEHVDGQRVQVRYSVGNVLQLVVADIVFAVLGVDETEGEALVIAAGQKPGEAVGGGRGGVHAAVDKQCLVHRAAECVDVHPDRAADEVQGLQILESLAERGAEAAATDEDGHAHLRSSGADRVSH